MTFVDYGNSRPFYPPRSLPLPSSVPLSDDERATVQRLQQRFDFYMPSMLKYNAYYSGEQVTQNLGISVPPELNGLRALTGWCRVPVDPLVDRLCVDGFRFPGQTDVDPDLEAAWVDNGCDASQSIGFTEALVLGKGYVVVSSPSEPGGLPRVTFDSPFSLIASWNPRTMLADCALQSYWEGDARRATILLPDKTIDIAADQDGESWSVVNVDEHNFGRVPVHRMANSPRANQRDGVSEIIPELMTITDAACRTLQSLEVAGQFYSVPQKIILGAAERDFVNSDGSPKSGWSTYMSAILALEADDQGNLPQIHQFTAYDPSVYTKVVEMYASLAAGIVGAPAQDFGLYTVGNPVSAEAAQVAENRRDRRALRKQSMFGAALRGAMKDVVRFMNGGELPESAARVEVDWADPKMYSIAQMTDALTKQISAGMVPATSDVVLKRAGYSPVERTRLAQDMESDKAEQFLHEAASSVMAGVTRDMKILGQGADGAALAPKKGVAAPTASEVESADANA